MLPILLTVLVLCSSDPARPTPENVTLRGEVVRLVDVLKPRAIPADSGPIDDQMVLRAADGTITPLLSDPASRSLFLDQRLRNRPAELLGRRHEGLPYLQVTSFRVEEDGVLRIPEYYCDVCTISVRYPQPCPCCQGELELRMRPEDQ